MKEGIVVVIPAHNEASSITAVLEAVVKQGWLVVVVDDGSVDQTAELAQELTPHVVSHRVNLGKGAAMKTGALFAFDCLNATSVIFMDADGQHDSVHLAEIAARFHSGSQVVLGVRDLTGGMPALRALGNRLVSWACRLLFGVYIPDILCGYKGMTKLMFEQLEWEAAGYEVEIEIAAKLALSRQEFVCIPVKTIYFDLERGMNLLDSIKTLGHMLSFAFRRGILNR